MSMPSKKLHSIIYSSFLTSSMIPLIVIEVCLLVVYFGINHYIAAKHQQALLAEVTTSLDELAGREAGAIDNRLKEVTRTARIMRANHEDFFRQPDACALPNGEPDFARHGNGAWYKARNNGGSSLYYSSSTIIGPTEKAKARCSECLDPLLKSIVESNPLITQVYLNTWDNMNRLYPFMSDAPAQYGPVLHMQDFNFYYEADAAHNPERKPVWTGAYLDPAGQGWMLSLIVPVYNGDFLEGVSGLDVTIATFIHHVLDLHIPWEGKSFLVDTSGMILAMPESVGTLFGLNELTQHTYTDNIRTTVEKPEEFNIFRMRDEAIKEQMRTLFDSRARMGTLRMGESSYLVSQAIVPETGWRLFTLVDETVIFAKISELRRLSNAIGYTAILAMCIFYAIFFLFLERKSLRLSTMIARPIERLSELTTTIITTRHALPHEDVGIAEIDVLGRNFSTMSEALDRRTQELVEAQIRERTKESEAERLERLALTDRLTELYNRHKLDTVLQAELDRFRRNRRPFGIMLMDLDHFKQVNDTFGHQIGDLLLKELAILLKNTIRTTDTVGRWGGEEFLFICPETNAEGLFSLADKLRVVIARHAFPVANFITASFGVTINLPDDTIVDIIARADKALYTAKNEGRNRVATFTADILH